MFKIYLLNASNYPTEIYNDLNVIDPIVLEPELEYNGENGILIGKLSFKLRNPDFEYDLRLLHNTVIVTQVINGVETVIFRGRPLLRDDDNYNDQDYTFEGILAGLNDTLQAPSNKEIGGRLYEHFVTIIDWHNNQVRSISNNRLIDYSKISRTDSKSHMYTISGRDPIHIFIEKMVKYTRFRASTMDHIKTQYVDAHGGYFYLEDEPLTYDSSGCVVLHNYLKYVDIYNPDQTHINSQHIEFGKNLISVKRSASADDFATVLVPLGKQLTDIDKAWPYYQSVENNKLRKIVSSPDDAEIINYNSTGASIDSETGKEYRNLSSAYVLPRDVDVNPGDVFYLTTYLEGVSTDKGIATYAILDRATGSKVYAMGTSVRNSKESGGAVTVKNVVLKDERIEIPDIEEQGVDLKLRTAYMISANDPNGGFVLKKFNKNYQEDNVTIMSADPLTTGTIRKTGQYPVGRDVYPDATDTPTAPETYEQSKRIVNKDLFDVFGSIERSIEFSDYGIDEVNDIVGVASKELEKMGEDLEIEIEAADMSYIDDSQEPFRPYDLIPVKSDPHGLDMMLPIVKMTLPLADPAAATYTLQNDIHLSEDGKKYISQMVSSPGANAQKNQTVVIYNGGGSGGGSGEQGPPGPAGYSPTVAVTAITGGHTVTITDENGDHPFNVMDGEDGQDGADGVSPAVTVTPIEGGNRITITDKTHPSGISFDVMDGEDGSSSDLKHTATIQKYNGSWRLVSDSTTMTWEDLWNNQADDMTLITVDGSNIRHLHKTGIEFTSGSTVNSVNIYFSDQRYNGRTAEGNVYRLTVPSDGSTGTITEITGADIPTSGGSGSAPYEIPITYTDMWVSSRSSDEIYAHADNCILNVDGTTMDVLSAERYVEDGDQFVRIVAVDYTSFDSATYEFTALEIIAQNSNTYTPIISKYEYNSKDLIGHKIFLYNESTGAITKSEGGAATGADISGSLLSESVYVVGFIIEDGDLTYRYYEPLDDSTFKGSTGSVRFYRSTDAGTEILAIPTNGSTATKTTVPAGNADCHLKITATYNSVSQSYTFDKTASEIIAAVSAGKIPVVAVASTGTGGQFTNDQWMYAESSFDGEDTYIKFYSLRQNGDVEYMMYVDSEQSAYTYLYQALPPATAANNGKIPKIVNGRWTISDPLSDDKHYTFYYSVNDDDWDLDYDEITSLLASGYDIQCKIICGNSEFYAKLRRNRKNSQEGPDIYAFDAQTYQDEEGTMWWMSVRVTENNVVNYLEGSYVPAPVIYHRVTLNADGTVKTKPSSLTYARVYPRLIDNQVSDYLLITWGSTQFLAKAVEHISGSVSDIKFIADCEHDGIQRHMVFTLDTSNALTTTLIETYSRRPVIVWEVQDATQGLSALNTNITANLAWQLTNLDLTPFKRIKIYSRAGRKTGAIAADSSITPASIIEMSLDDRAKETVSQNVFIGSSIVQNPNDANCLGILTCAVSADKTKFAVVRATTLYGTAATSNTDAYPNVFMIEGYYD